MEVIRRKTMNMLRKIGATSEKWNYEFSLSCNEVFQINKGLAAGCVVLFNGDIGYEISEGEDTHTICLNAKSCTCRGWDFSGISYQHAICALLYNKEDPMDHIFRWFHKASWDAAYKNKIMHVRGKRFYRLQNYLLVAPPKVEKKKG